MPKVPEDKSLSIWKPFSREDFPTHTSWVQKLNASEALSQYVAWGVTPAKPLEENRVLLKQFIKANSKAPPNEAVVRLSAAHLISTATYIATSVGAATQFTALAPPGQADPFHNHTTEPPPLGQTDSLGGHTAEPHLPHLSCTPDWQQIIANWRLLKLLADKSR